MRSKQYSFRAAARRAGLPLHAGTAVLLSALAAPALASAAPAKAEAGPASASGHYEKLRAQLRWVPVRVGSRELLTPDAGSRLLLVRSAAQRAGLAEVGLDFRDVYGVISAETSWFARDGLGRNGVTSQGLAQLEPATARSLGVRDANDPVEAVHAAATLLKEAAQWSARRIAGLQLDGAQHAARLREGVSIYYNLSSARREQWKGTGIAALPIETQHHIRNVREGIVQADRLAGGTGPVGLLPVVAAAQPAMRPVSMAVATKPAAPRALGTIEWSGSGSDADGRRAGRHTVWSNGTVTQERGRARWTSGVAAGQRDG